METQTFEATASTDSRVLLTLADMADMADAELPGGGGAVRPDEWASAPHIAAMFVVVGTPLVFALGFEQSGSGVVADAAAAALPLGVGWQNIMAADHA